MDDDEEGFFEKYVFSNVINAVIILVRSIGLIISCITLHAINKSISNAYNNKKPMCYASHGDSRPIYASFIKGKNGGQDDIVLHGQKNSQG